MSLIKQVFYMQSSSKKVFKSGIAFNTLYLLKYFGMVTTEQKEVEACWTRAEGLPADQKH